MIDSINESRFCHIITVEDPIEFVHRSKNSLINQRELGHDTWSFTAALRSALREDPDVILVGEMRDLETVSLGLTAARDRSIGFCTLQQ
jgi:twitching motility protein PilT